MKLRYKIPALLGVVLICQACTGRPPISQTPDSFQQFRTDVRTGAAVAELAVFLSRYDVNDVVPLHELLQQGTQWHETNQARYAVPPQHLWPNMVDTLKLLDRFIIPAVGPISVVSGFRSSTYNRLAGGARRSQHLQFSALDVIPTLEVDRSSLHSKLLQLWNVHGRQLNMGLGLYSGTRFHIDTGGYRKWQG
jgi:uncharacterized protein YcbK (DUF882 family)